LEYSYRQNRARTPLSGLHAIWLYWPLQ